MAGGKKKKGEPHSFGGDWTTEKLDMLGGYLQAYAIALRKRPFEILYIDAFAGSGSRTAGRNEDTPLFPDLAAKEADKLLDGSARIALKMDPGFDSYVFIEKDRARCEDLEKLRAEFPNRKIDIRNGEANAAIRALCKGEWKKRRAVMFLDPYGMQVDFATLETIANTRAIDVWILFPLGIGVSRLLTKTGKIPPGWEKKLDTFLGTKDWRNAFYRKDRQTGLFGDADEIVKQADFDAIATFFNDRLKTIFPGVADHPRALFNSSMPLYLFCFAIGNPDPKAKALALRIANHILNKVS